MVIYSILTHVISSNTSYDIKGKQKEYEIRFGYFYSIFARRRPIIRFVNHAVT